jgi:multidrug efflux pump subunit AcrA (membrane-fusion protein)
VQGKREAGVAFEVREVEVGPEANGTMRILAGLKAGERIVVKGAFTLKTQLIKGELGHDD